MSAHQTAPNRSLSLTKPVAIPHPQADFGTATLAELCDWTRVGTVTGNAYESTHSTTMSGTLAWAAPEVCPAGPGSNCRSDPGGTCCQRRCAAEVLVYI